MAVILVGAMIVAAIETVWAGRVAPPPRRVARVNHADTPEPVLLDRGAELGRFLLGSTVILLFRGNTAVWNARCEAGAAVRMGEQLAP